MLFHNCPWILPNDKHILCVEKFHHSSFLENHQVNQEDLLELLGKAVTCAVLGKAGPQRSRVLGLLYKVTVTATARLYHLTVPTV